MTIEGQDDLASLLKALAGELRKLHDDVALRTAETAAVDGVRRRCDEDYLAMEYYRQDILANENRRERETELISQLSEIIKGLRTVREVIGDLVEVLQIRDKLSGTRRLPRDFFRRHSAVERSVGDVRPLMKGLADEIDKSAGPPGSRRNVRENLKPLDDSGDTREYRQPARAQRRRIKFG